MKNKSVVKRKILTVVIGLLLLISYILGKYRDGKAWQQDGLCESAQSG